jgi:hypothetical protein
MVLLRLATVSDRQSSDSSWAQLDLFFHNAGSHIGVVSPLGEKDGNGAVIGGIGATGFLWWPLSDRLRELLQ